MKSISLGEHVFVYNKFKWKQFIINILKAFGVLIIFSVVFILAFGIITGFINFYFPDDTETNNPKDLFLGLATVPLAYLITLYFTWDGKVNPSGKSYTNQIRRLVNAPSSGYSFTNEEVEKLMPFKYSFSEYREQAKIIAAINDRDYDNLLENVFFGDVIKFKGSNFYKLTLSWNKNDGICLMEELI